MDIRQQNVQVAGHVTTSRIVATTTTTNKTAAAAAGHIDWRALQTRIGYVLEQWRGSVVGVRRAQASQQSRFTAIGVEGRAGREQAWRGHSTIVHHLDVRRVQAGARLGRGRCGHQTVVEGILRGQATIGWRRRGRGGGRRR